MKRFKPRQFSFTPRYYDPAKDPEERKKRKLSFSRGRKFVLRKSTVFRNLLILAVVILVYLRAMKII